MDRAGVEAGSRERSRMTALIMLAATVAYFAVTIPLASWIGRFCGFNDKGPRW